jgi:hypothetical protein
MYGGLFYEKQPGLYKTGFCGIFCYKSHISLEFTKGAHLDDPANVLEKTGKLRRHIKLRSLQDLQTKAVETYIRQACDQQKIVP